LARQPFGKIPVLVDTDGTTLYESRAICRYLLANYGEKHQSLFQINDPKKYGFVEQWISVEMTNFDPSISGLVSECFFKPVFYGGKTDDAVVEKLRASAEQVLDVYDEHLKKNKYLCGDKLTIADLFHLPYAYYLCTKTKNGDLIHSRKHLTAWYEGMVALESAQKVLPR